MRPKLTDLTMDGRESMRGTGPIGTINDLEGGGSIGLKKSKQFGLRTQVEEEKE